MADVDWGILQPMPNFTQSALAGYQAGTNIKRQQAIDTALQGIDLDRPETLLPVLRADPSTGAALIGASTKLAAEKREMEWRKTSGALVKALPQFGGGVVSDGGGIAAEMPVNGGLTAPTLPGVASGADGNDIVVNGQRQPSLQQLRDAAIDADPDQFLQLQEHLGKLDEAALKKADDTTEAFATVGQGLLSVPYEQRKAYLQAQSGYLIQHGVNPQQIAAFDPTDQNIHAQVGQALGVKGMVEQEWKKRNYDLDVAQFDETKQQHAISNANAAGNLAVSQGNLALSRQREGRIEAGGGAGGSSRGSAGVAAPKSKADYDKIPKGTRYRAPDGSMRVKN